MTKQELVSEMAETLKISKKQCKETLNAMLEEIIQALSEGKRFVQPGFGTFKTTETNEHIGRNPITQKKMLYPKKIKLKFKASDKLKGEINE